MTASPVRLVELGPDDPAFARWCAVRAASDRADRPGDVPRSAGEHAALARQLAEPGGARSGMHRAAVVGEDVVGGLRLILPMRDNTTIALLDLAVHPAHRRRGVGSALLADALRLATLHGRTSVLAEVHEREPSGPGRQFALRHGWRCDLVETRRDLLLPPDEARLSAVEAEACSAARDYELVTWRDHTPEHLLDDRAVLEARMSTDAPHGDLPVEAERWDAARIRADEAAFVARGRTVLSAGATKDGRLVAFTDLQVPLDRPEHAHQGGTLVLREHRGHRLGALVKAAVLRNLAAQLPQVRRISTYNSDSNTPMVAVNEALGFVPAARLTTWSRDLS